MYTAGFTFFGIHVMRFILTTTWWLAVLFQAAMCGQKGPLSLPDEQGAVALTRSALHGTPGATRP